MLLSCIDMNIAIIPARSGSKGLKNKNIRPLNGKPLMVYTIEAAKKSGIFDEIHVSTDSQEYANIAVEGGATVPFLRPAMLSSDTTGTWDVVEYILNQYQELNKKFDTVTVLQPTSPLRTATDILQAFQIFLNKKARAVVSVCEVEHSPLWCNTLPADYSMNNFIPPDILSQPRQMLPKYYRLNGALYILKSDFICNKINLYQDNCYAYPMPAERSIDIDSYFDFIMAEALLALADNIEMK